MSCKNRIFETNFTGLKKEEKSSHKKGKLRGSENMPKMCKKNCKVRITGFVTAYIIAFGVPKCFGKGM